jgi:hypothetical protein
VVRDGDDLEILFTFVSMFTDIFLYMNIRIYIYIYIYIIICTYMFNDLNIYFKCVSYLYIGCRRGCSE